MSTVSPVIADWMRLKLKWGYVSATILRPRTLAPGESFQLPMKDFIFSYPEIVLLTYAATFDHPNCGLRIEGYPDFDTQSSFTITNLTLGLIRPEPLIYAILPPVSPPGYYSVRIPSPWVFEKWMRLYVFNADSIPHTLLGHGYYIAALKQPRPDDSIVPLETMKRIQLVYEIYPERREELRYTLAEHIDGWLGKNEVKKIELKKEES